MGHNGGCHADDGDPLPSPVHALGMLLEEDGELSVELSLVSTATASPTHVDGAEAWLVDPAGERSALARVGPGSYVLDGSRSPLRYVAAESFELGFVLEEGLARAYNASSGTFFLSLHGGLERPEVWLTEAGEVAWSPAGARVILDVHDARGERTFATLDWSDPAIGAASWRGFPSGGVAQLPASAWRGGGPHSVRVCVVEVFRRDGEPAASPQHALDGAGGTTGLGWLSGGVAGRCARLERS